MVTSTNRFIFLLRSSFSIMHGHEPTNHQHNKTPMATSTSRIRMIKYLSCSKFAVEQRSAGDDNSYNILMMVDPHHLRQRIRMKRRTATRRKNRTWYDSSSFLGYHSSGLMKMTVWILIVMIMASLMMATTPTSSMVAPFQHSTTTRTPTMRRRPSTKAMIENRFHHHRRRHHHHRDRTGSDDHTSTVSLVLFASSRVVTTEEENDIDMGGVSTLSEEQTSTSKVKTTGVETEKKRSRRSWNKMFPKLQAYYDEHGHSNVTSKDDPDLYGWIETLRLNYRGQIIRIETKTDVFVERKRRKRSSSSDDDDNNNNDDDDDDDGDHDEDHGNNQSTKDRRRQELPNYKLQLLQGIKFSWNTSSRTSPLIRKVERVKMRRSHKQNSNITTTSSSSAPSSFSFHPPTTSFTTESPERKRRKKYKLWSVYYPKLVDFYNANGHSDVNIHNCGDGNEDLVDWVKQLRIRCRYQVFDKFPSTKDGRRMRRIRDADTARTKGGTRKLSDQQLQQLEDLDFQWYNFTRGYYEPWNVAWSIKYERLVEFYREHGHCNPKRSEDPQLADFVTLQRKYYRRRLQNLQLVSGHKSMPLTDTRIALLEKVGFEWGKSNERRWKDMCEDLTVYKKEYGDTAVPQDFHKDPQLGHWVMNQRTFYRLKEEGQYSPLDEYRISDLQNLGFEFQHQQQRADENWYEMLGWAQSYHAEHGNLTIPVSDTAHTRLRLWLNAQRVFYKRDKLAEDSNERDEDDEGAGSGGLDNNDDLQITRRRRPHLSQEKIEALEAIDGFRWSYRTPSKYPTSADWSRMFTALRDRGITANAKPKRHWFDGVNPLRDEVKSVWTEDELVALWYEEDDDDEDEYYEDEETQNFLRA